MAGKFTNKDFDIYLGKQLRSYRLQRNMTLMSVAKQVGMSYQQIQKYESANSKVSVALLFELASIYRISVDSLFQGFVQQNQITSYRLRDALSNIPEFKVLIIEDNPADEAITRKALNDIQGLDILCVHDSIQAMELLKYKTLCSTFTKPDLIFLDIYLPKRDGVSILKDLKRDQSFINTPVVMLTNNVNLEVMISAYKYGAVGYICKSFNFSEFKESVVNCINYWFRSVIPPSKVAA